MTKMSWTQRGNSFSESSTFHMKKPLKIITNEPQATAQYSNFSMKL